MEMQKLIDQANEAIEAGFMAAGAKLLRQADRARKLAIAYEHYRFVTQEQIAAFRQKLIEKTRRPATDEDKMKLGNPTAYFHADVVQDQLMLVALEKYEGLPPAEVLGQVKAARDRGIFDAMEVASVEPVSTRIKLPDPIVFGRIEGCSDYFYVCEWGSDVSIHDLLGQHEG